MKVNDSITPAIGVAKVMLIIAGIFLYGCEKKTNGPDDGSDGEPSGTNKGLFVSFKTPGWSEKIDCSHLSFLPNSCDPAPNNSVYYVYATSDSTKMIFHNSYTVDIDVPRKLI